MFPNKYAGACHVCGRQVGQEAGFVIKVDGKWKCLCKSTACHRTAGYHEDRSQPQPIVRRMDEHGVITFQPFDKTALPLLRSFPGARWQPESKTWKVSLALQDRARVLHLANQLDISVPASIYEYETPEAVQEAQKRAQQGGARDYQVNGAGWLALRDKALLGDDMGLGKSAQWLWSLDASKPALVICPASLKFNWRNEANRWRPELRVTVLAGRGSWKAPEAGELVVVNYDILPGEIKKSGKQTSVDNAALVNPGTQLIVDEAQAVKNQKTARHQRIKAIAAQCERVVFATGTPLQNKPPDLWGILSCGQMEKAVFGSWNGFLKAFNARRVTSRRGETIVISTNPAEDDKNLTKEVKARSWIEYGFPIAGTADKLRRVMLRRTKDEVLTELPPKIYTDLEVNGLSDSLRAEMDALYEEEEYSDELPPFEKISGIRAKLASSRIPALLEIVENYEESDTPLIVFSAHRAPIDALENREFWGVITGDTPAAKRAEVVKDFQLGKLKGIALTIGAGGTGLTLTRGSHMLFVDLAWTPSDNLQAEDRFLRIGQTADSVNITRMVSDHPLDKHVLKILSTKQSLIEKAIAEEIEVGAAPTVIEETDEELAARLAERDRVVREAAATVERAKYFGKITQAVVTRDIEVREYSDEEKERIHAAHSAMIAMCDGAVQKDGVGFNKPDAAVMHWMFHTGYDSNEACALAESILKHYPGQLSERFPELFPKYQNEQSQK